MRERKIVIDEIIKKMDIQISFFGEFEKTLNEIIGLYKAHKESLGIDQKVIGELVTAAVEVRGSLAVLGLFKEAFIKDGKEFSLKSLECLSGKLTAEGIDPELFQVERLNPLKEHLRKIKEKIKVSEK